MINFSDRLKQLRAEKQLTQQDLAKVLNISRATIAGYEAKGKEPDYDRLKEIADYFNVTVDYLLGRTNIREGYNENYIPDRFETPEEAVKFILEDNTIMRFGGFDINKFTYEEKVEFANELLNHIKFLAFKRNEAKNK